MVKLENISKTYSKGKVRAVDNLSLHVEKGEIFGFIGPNGAGKTTTIKMLTGALPPDSGAIYIDGTDMLHEPIAAKRKIGFVPDSHEMFDRLTGAEYLGFIGNVYCVRREDRTPRIEKYLKMFELEQAVSQYIRGYSHGMKQKLMLIGALLSSPPLWVLDEPMVGLDPRSSMRLKEEMREHCKKGNTVFFSTHILEVAERLCDRIGIISDGKLIAVGTMEALRSQERDATLEQLFFELTGEAEQ